MSNWISVEQTKSADDILYDVVTSKAEFRNMYFGDFTPKRAIEEERRKRQPSENGRICTVDGQRINTNT